MRRELVASVALILALGLGVACAMRETAIPVIPEVEAQRQQEAAEAADVEVADAAAALVSGQPVHQFFADTCGGCHGPQREGGTGPALIPGRLDQPPEFYADVIRNGRPGTIMPPWGAAMAEEDIDTLVNFILSEPSEETVAWELEDIAATREVLIEDADLPDAPTHSGNVDNLMLITEREARSIAVVDGDTHELLGKIDASYRAHGYIFDPTEPRWAYNLGRDGWLFKIDLYSLEAVTKVRVGHDARGLAISDDGRFVIAGNYIPHSAVILDAETLEPLKVIHTEGVDPDGNFVGSRVCIVSDVSEELVGPYFIIALKEAGQMWRIDYSDPEFPIDKVENVGRILHDGFLNLDNTRFYIASQTDNWMTVVDVENWEIVEKIPTGDTPHPGSGAVWEANGTSYGATVHAGEGKITVWDLEDNAIVAEIPTQGPGLFIRSTHHSPYVWADAMFATPANEITVFDGSTFEVVTRITDGTLPLHPEFTADGSAVYVSDWEEDVVRVYDAETFELITTIEGIQEPTGIFNSSRRAELLGH
ncbi:MAG TPA: cytochrome D1 domain-containing protein [Aggregatilineales bacterium]|nr:cytochrome D1 domain-containing protein [Aggregatilineales bacterium]